MGVRIRVGAGICGRLSFFLGKLILGGLGFSFLKIFGDADGASWFLFPGGREDKRRVMRGEEGRAE